MPRHERFQISAADSSIAAARTLFRLAFALFVLANAFISSARETDGDTRKVPPTPGVHVVTLGVSDLDRSYRFYKETLEFPTEMTPEHGIVLFTTSGAKLFIYQRSELVADIGPSIQDADDPTERFSGMTFGQAYGSRDAVDAILLKVEEAGGRILAKAKVRSWGGYSGYFSDPDGFVWEAAFFDEWTFTPEGSLVF